MQTNNQIQVYIKNDVIITGIGQATQREWIHCDLRPFSKLYIGDHFPRVFSFLFEIVEMYSSIKRYSFRVLSSESWLIPLDDHFDLKISCLHIMNM